MVFKYECNSFVSSLSWKLLRYEEEDTCMSYEEEEDTCVLPLLETSQV
jgi:hypothetical protein